MRRTRFKINVKQTISVYKALAPSLWEEFEGGLKDALEWPIERILLEFGGYRTNIPKSGCSIMSGNGFLIRNYDYHPKTYDGSFLASQPTDDGLATIGSSQRVTGRSDGMNEQGLALGYTFINRKKPGDGFVCHMIGRLVLELCKNIEEEVQLLKELPHRGSFSYVLYDTNSTLVTIVETFPRGIEIRENIACTNHFERLTKDNRHFLVDSTKRMDLIQEKELSSLTSEKTFQLFNSTTASLFFQQYYNWAGTIHTSAFFPSDLTV
ncbi:choloylglycine hydrolase [Gracilibacillus boraciitolerans JCM 21714]|uniref:Choloylglycine hydrolase n=1 Tax=Gracilibacillus boraciitolerans JCM 21714 TaxID=1298598 RepID=W4VHL6_9BACI|nr:choloylglycine hydrolase [Gracilibacillus boraciitolerans JCM 21714]